MKTKRYPGQGHPWADFLNSRARVLAMWHKDGRPIGHMVRDMQMDPLQVGLILMTVAEHPEEYDQATGDADTSQPEEPMAVKAAREAARAATKAFREGPNCPWFNNPTCKCQSCLLAEAEFEAHKALAALSGDAGDKGGA